MTDWWEMLIALATSADVQLIVAAMLLVICGAYLFGDREPESDGDERESTAPVADRRSLKGATREPAERPETTHQLKADSKRKE